MNKNYRVLRRDKTLIIENQHKHSLMSWITQVQLEDLFLYISNIHH